MKLNKLHAIYTTCKNGCFFFIFNTLFYLFLFQLPAVAGRRPRTGERLCREASWPHRARQQGAAGALRAPGSQRLRASVPGCPEWCTPPPFSYLTAHAGKGKGSQPTSVFRTVEAWLKWSRADREALSLCWWTAFRGQSFLLTTRSFCL